MIQLVTPNIDTPTEKNLCLRYVQTAYKSPNAGATAHYAWTQTKLKHLDRNFPTGVYYIAWFDSYGTINGVTQNWGHVVIGKDGVFYSSPYTNKTTHDVLGSIEEVERRYGSTFVGWSEDIAGLRVIKEDDMHKASKDEINAVYIACCGRGASEQEVAIYLDREFAICFLEVYNSTEAVEYRENYGTDEYIKVTDLYIKKGK